ncbi:GNAT family N-acetyltransferase [Bacillus pseudomycoides]|uniref:GNAT family N-acetyltransferase n=1 Tax=Bacillus pseudomycoides TaxID=64104 RepID=A0A2C3WH74_9BACI|nr:GNAT family N-acetyltransferase [Bacillus pseudomycoides]PDY44886.1 GNAT family N-acetyltransferase [Bacillus pseudomycoides]PEA82157.1 GNAT family N-acetyltransferase [Bacillus pseudomycoides]PED68828.1 GNAT family N-acetyltransferase [Bacillus pseudomycoides]PEI39904.1 GNAT family N-acetyltransferase [Bacillus pseudomycoides]PEJ79108.1 GNAT family N-acetyltransferase [Bacillus pseudomycoides]
MIQIQKASVCHVEGISKVCSDGWRDTYVDLKEKEYIDAVIEEFYQFERIYQEVTLPMPGWDGWYVALENGEVVGAGGGGMISGKVGELFVLYLNPSRRSEGIGTMLLNTITERQIEQGATEQWVSVMKGNQKGIPFYEARGFVQQSSVDLKIRYRRDIS